MLDLQNLPEFSQAGDPCLDFCLWNYQPVLPWQDKFRSINLLDYSFAVTGVEDTLPELCTALRASLGDWKTVWGVKNIAGSLSWEFYFYDYSRLAREVSITRVMDVFRRFTNCSLCINEDCLYFMFSIDIDNDLVTGKRDLDEINIYLGDVSEHVSAGICYLLDKKGLRMDNLYHFFDAKTEMEQIADKVVSSLHLTLADFDINGILMPELLDCQTIVVANKKYNDGIYFSRITVDQLLVFLKMMKYPHKLVESVQNNRSRFNHLLYDVGVDYRMEAGNIRFLKSSYYGVF